MTRFSVWWTHIDPTQNGELTGHRPVVVVSPNEMNKRLATVIVAPMTTALRGWPTRLPVRHNGKSAEIALDQLRTVDQFSLGSTKGDLDPVYHAPVLDILAEMFHK